jgi:hypothetical protein
MDTYEKQAKDFLESTGTNVKKTFVRHGSMHWDESSTNRNVWEICISRNGEEYSFEYGDSLANSNKKVPVIEIDERQHKEYFGWRFPESGVKIILGSRSFTMYDLRTMSSRELSSKLFPKEELQKILEEQKGTCLYSYLDKLKKSRGYLSKKDTTDFNAWFFRKTIGRDHGENIRDSIVSRIDKLKEKFSRQTDYDSKRKAELTPPSDYSILSSLYVSYFEDIDDMIDEYGFDMSTREKRAMAQTTWELTKEMDEKLKLMYNEEELESIQEIC